MDRVREFLDEVKRQRYATGNLLGLFHILIGRRLTRDDGTIISTGLTWRNLAAYLKRCRWDKDEVEQLGIDASKLSPRDRERFWYQAITQAGVDSPAAQVAGDRLAVILQTAGIIVGTPPRSTS